jgi:putative solute:sodium symporter small subunit
MTASDPALAERRRRHWQATRRLTISLLLVWGLLTFGLTFFARSLSFSFFGWPFSYWVGAQGLLLVYLGLVGFYAWQMRRLDQAHELDEQD